MAQRTNKAILSRIHGQLAKLGKTPHAASIEAGLGKDAIRDLERRPDVIPRLDTIEALAPILEMSPEQLAFGEHARVLQAGPQTIRIIGEVAAGLWLAVDAIDEEREYEKLPVPADPRYQIEAQYGLMVRGTSINRIARSGDVLQCVDLGITGIEPTDGDLVVVERRRAQAGEKEVTAKRWRMNGRKIELMPDSDDHRWETLVLDPKHAGENEEIAVVAIVIGVYRPLRRP